MKEETVLGSMMSVVNSTVLCTLEKFDDRCHIKCSYHKKENKTKEHKETFVSDGQFVTLLIVTVPGHVSKLIKLHMGSIL
jgi:hypothetical protein